MAIQNRRGLYADFNPNRLVPGEWAVVLSGDPNSETGRSVYVCFAPGQVKRMVTYEDLLENINSLTDEIKELFTADVKEAIRLATEATTKATQATSAAVEATTKAGQAVANTQGVIAVAEEKIREMQDLIDAGLGGGTGGGGGATGDVKFLTEYIGSGTISDFGESVPIGNVDLTKYSDLVAVFSINDWNEGSEIVLIPNALIESGGYQFSTTLYEQGGLPTIIRYIIGNSQPLGLVVQEYESLGTNPTVHVGFFGRKLVGNVAVGEIGDIASAPVTFTQAGTRTNISSGETLRVIFGKIMRFFNDLGTAAFRGVSNVLTTTAAGVYVLDAFQGKVLKDLHDELKARVDKLKIYRSFTELGLSNSPTVSQVVNAMENGSVLIMNQDADNSIIGSPNILTLLTVKRMLSHRITLELMGESGSWFMAGNVTTLATASWRKVVDTNALGGAVVRRGSATATLLSGTDYVDVTVNYTGFSATPVIVATAQHNSTLKITAKIQSKTATSAVIRVFSQANVTGQNGTTINWIAIGD